MLTLSDIRKGKMIVLDGQPYQIISAEFLRKQQRRPVVRTMLRNIKTDQTKEHSFQQSDKVPEANVERQPYQYLYKNGELFVFMNRDTYEQVEIGAEVVGEAEPYLLDQQEVEVVVFEGGPVSIELPIKINRKVVEAPPGVKGDTSSNVTKEVLIEGGLKIRAPLFVKEGDVIRIDTRSGEYIEKA